MTMNKMIFIHMLKRFIYFKNNIELGPLVSMLSTFWEDTHGCKKQYRCNTTIYLITMILYLYGIIMEIAIQKNTSEAI